MFSVNRFGTLELVGRLPSFDCDIKVRATGVVDFNSDVTNVAVLQHFINNMRLISDI